MRNLLRDICAILWYNTVMFNPKYTIIPDMLAAISEISEVKAIVERSRVLPLNEAQLRRQAIIRMAHTSTSIEGNKLAEFQVDKVLSGMSVNADQKSILEVKNYQLALQETEKLATYEKPLTRDNILKLHEILMHGLVEKEKFGHFRPADIFLVDDYGDGREHLRFKGPDAKKVPFLINELLTWLAKVKKDLHPIITAGIFHSEFVNIHPFVDGNGRMARLLTTLILSRAGWDFRKILVLEDFYNRNRQEYYDALASSSGPKYKSGVDYTPWLEYFIAGFLVEARKVSEKIQSIGFGKSGQKNQQVFLDSDEIKIMDFLTTTGRVTSDDVVDILKIAKRTSQLKLKGLLEKGLIKQEGKARATFYTLSS